MRLLLPLVALLCASSASAQPYLYWATETDSTIARANLDGSDIDLDFIADQARPWDVVVDDTYIYWTNSRGGSIGRALLDGSDVDPGFITGASMPRSLARDDTYLYWNNRSVNAIGRARLDGTEVIQGYVPSGFPDGLAISDSHIYWATIANDAIRRSNLDASGIEDAFVGNVEFVTSLVIADDFLYWGPADAAGIGRVGLDGSDPTPGFIPEATAVFGLATDGEALYVARADGPIDRVNLDGSGYTTLIAAEDLGVIRGLTVSSSTNTASMPDVLPGTPSLQLAVAPNPTSASTTITVTSARGDRVQVTVYDLLGRHVADLFDGAVASRTPQTMSFDTAGLPAGVYLVRAQSRDGVEVKRLTVAR